MTFSKRRGMLIVFSLLFTTIVLILVGSVMILTRQGRFVSQTHASRIAAIYAAEAGVADAVEQLNEDNTWAPTTNYVMHMSNNSASYSFQFAPGPTLDPNLSVNNLAGATSVDGPLGPGSVPRHSVYLVVNGTAGPSSRQLHVVLNSTPFQSQRGPFVTSGRVALKGEVSIVGRKSFTDWTPVKAGIHSNLSGAINDVITWEREGAGNAFIDGVVSASSISPNAITTEFGTGTGNFDADEELHGEPSRRFPRLRVGRAVDRAFESPTVTDYSPPATQPATPLTGELRMVAPPGGWLEINGDLNLQDANLYIDGNFRVNGSIRGNGSVFVKGDTTFSGASEVTVGTIDHTAVYSSGHVKLEGFSGTDFLDAMTTTPHQKAGLERGLNSLQTHLGQTTPDYAKVEILRNYLAGTIGPEPPPAPAGATPAEIQAADDAILAYQEDLLYLRNELNAAPDLTVVFADDDVRDTSGIVTTLRTEITTLANGSPSPDDAPTLNFLKKKFSRLDDILGNPDAADPVTPAVLAQYRNRGEVNAPGLLQHAIGDPGDELNLLSNELRSLHFDALGNSYFKGIIFTGGAIHSSNDVEVFGGIFAHRSSESPLTPLVVDGVPFNSGDVSLNNGCRVTYVEELVDNPASRLNRNLVVPVSWFTPKV